MLTHSVLRLALIGPCDIQPGQLDPVAADHHRGTDEGRRSAAARGAVGDNDVEAPAHASPPQRPLPSFRDQVDPAGVHAHAEPAAQRTDGQDERVHGQGHRGEEKTGEHSQSAVGAVVRPHAGGSNLRENEASDKDDECPDAQSAGGPQPPSSRVVGKNQRTRLDPAESLTAIGHGVCTHGELLPPQRRRYAGGARLSMGSVTHQ